jgi:hypothetical protein
MTTFGGYRNATRINVWEKVLHAICAWEPCCVPATEISPQDRHCHCGTSDKSFLYVDSGGYVYRRHDEPFLQDLGRLAEPDYLASLSHVQVSDFLQRQAPRFARATRKNLVITLRPLLMVCFRDGVSLDHD